MSISNRLGALGALSVLAACSTAASTNAIDGDSLAAAASVYTPTYFDEELEPSNADFVLSDTVGDGLVGFMGFSDGVVRPVRVRIAEDESSAFLSVNGGPEVEFDTEEEGGWSGPSGFFRPDVSAYYENFVVFEGEDGSYAAGFFGQQTGPDDLMSDVVTFSGSGDMEGDSVSASFGLTMDVDFTNSSIDGSVEGGFIDFGEEFESEFTGTLTGELAGSFFAMQSDVTGEDLTGDIGFLGAFYDYGEYFGGGAAGTINGETLGGDFAGSTDEGEFDGPFPPDFEIPLFE